MKKFQNKAKIIKVSKVLRTIAFAGLVLWVLMIPVSLATAILPPMLSKGLSFSFTQFLIIPMFVFAFIANLKIFRFFDRLKNACFFDAQTVGNLNATANWWLVLWFYEVVFFVLMQRPWANPHDFSLYHFPPDSGGLFAALTLKFVAWFFRVAQELQEEQELTV
jgi:Protein of unknown function (DUF2975)